MTQRQQLELLKGIPHPIIANVKVNNDGCELILLTNEGKYDFHSDCCHFPITGPYKVPLILRKELFRQLDDIEDDYIQEKDTEDSVTDIRIRTRVLRFIDSIGESIVSECLPRDLPANKRFYVFCFHTVGWTDYNRP